MRETANARGVSGGYVLHPAIVRQVRQMKRTAVYLRNMRNMAATPEMRAMYDRHLTAKLGEIADLENSPAMERLHQIAASVRPGLAFVMLETRGVA